LYLEAGFAFSIRTKRAALYKGFCSTDDEPYGDQLPTGFDQNRENCE
jgi:hypothetical protein